MFKNKNKFIYFIIFLIIFVISIWIYMSIFFKSVDRNTYLEAISWKVFLNNNEISLWKKKKLSKTDIIETKTKDSFAIIEWWDWSLTRLWWNTKIIIEEEFVSKNKNNINILFKLSSWKTWSNVVSYMWEDSYFKQVFSDNEAAVRWTIFVVDLEKDYIKVENHKISLKNENHWTVELGENKQFQISKFEFISLQDFIKSFKDKEFFNINKKLDQEYFLKLVKDLEKNFDNFKNFTIKEFDNLTLEQRKKFYEEFMEKYQEINFISLEYSQKLFDLKILLKEKLIFLAPENEKSNILDTISYDLKEIFNTKNFSSFENITNILKDNEKYINKKQLQDFFDIFNMKFNFKTTIEDGLKTFNENILNDPEYWKILDSLKKNFDNSIEEQKNIFLEFFNFLKNLFN